MKIGITGATSSIGADVAAEITSRGHEAVALVRRPTSKDRFYDLTEPVAPETLADLGAVIHLAWSWGDDQEVNRTAGQTLVEAAANAGVPVILLSTFSAFAASTSKYGAAKLDLENAVTKAGGSALRSGLIWGGPAVSGMMSTLTRIARMPALAPQLTPDPQMYFSNQGVLAKQLVAAALGEIGKGQTVLAAAHEPVGLSAILRTLRGPKRGMPVAVPSRLVAIMAGAAARVRIPLPFRPDSLSALTADTSPGSAGHSWTPDHPGSHEFLTWTRESAE